MDSVDNQRHAQSGSVSLVKLAKILSVVSASLLAVGNFVFTVLYFDKTANANFFDGVIVPILRVLPPDSRFRYALRSKTHTARV